MDPMTILGIGSAIAGGVGSIFGGKSQGAAIRQQNEQAMRNWIANNTQTTINNARQQFQAMYQFEQQYKRNSAIAQAAYQYQSEAKDALSTQSYFQQAELSKQLINQRSSLLNAIQTKGISSSSGTLGALATMQALNGLKSAVQLEKNRQMQASNIDKQTKNMLSQQTENIFMPNIQGYSEAPILGDAAAAERGGMISGLLQIGGAVAGAAVGFAKSSPKSGSGPDINQMYNERSGLGGYGDGSGFRGGGRPD